MKVVSRTHSKPGRLKLLAPELPISKVANVGNTYKTQNDA